MATSTMTTTAAIASSRPEMLVPKMTMASTGDDLVAGRRSGRRARDSTGVLARALQRLVSCPPEACPRVPSRSTPNSARGMAGVATGRSSKLVAGVGATAEAGYLLAAS